jgi:uncharacterized membrane protein HdeD (DUF308 family)
MYSTNGDVVCKGCFYTADALQRQLSGAKQMLLGGWCSIVVGILCVPFAFVGARKLFALLAGTLIAGGISGIRYGSQVLARARRDLVATQPR